MNNDKNKATYQGCVLVLKVLYIMENHINSNCTVIQICVMFYLLLLQTLQQLWNNTVFIDVAQN